jgi:alcohol dehydrogenase
VSEEDGKVRQLGLIAVVLSMIKVTMLRVRHVQIGLLPPAVVQGRASVPMHYVIGR